MTADALKNMFCLDGKVALIAGGGGDIGAACAKAMASYGAHIVLFDASQERLAAQKQEMEACEFEVETFWGDLLDEDFLERMIQTIISRHGRLDILLNSIAVTNRKPFLEMSRQEWETVINVNLNGAAMLLRAAGAQMCRQKSGKVIEVLSTGAYRFGANFTAYSASKAGLSALVKGLAIEWAPCNVQVNGIAPTATETNFTKDYYAQNPEKKEAVIRNHPYGRLGKVDDFVGAAVYLGSSAADFVIGAVIMIDSGKTVK